MSLLWLVLLARCELTIAVKEVWLWGGLRCPLVPQDGEEAEEEAEEGRDSSGGEAGGLAGFIFSIMVKPYQES